MDWGAHNSALMSVVMRYDRMSVLMKVSRSILRMQRGLLAWGGPFLSAGDETWMRVAKFSLDWM